MNCSILIICLTVLLFGCTEGRKFEEVQKVDSLQSINFVLTIEQTIDLSENQIYCATLAYTWNELRNKINADLQIATVYRQLRILDKTRAYSNTLAKDEIELSATLAEVYFLAWLTTSDLMESKQ